MTTYYFKQIDASGRVDMLFTYDGKRPKIENPLIVEITSEEYAVLLSEMEEKGLLAERVYAGKITINDAPEVWREEVQARVDAIIARQGPYDAQDISDTEALQIIMGGNADEA